MHLEEELLRLRAELEDMRTEQGDQQRQLEHRLARFSDKLDSLTRLVEQKTPTDDNVLEKSAGTTPSIIEATKNTVSETRVSDITTASNNEPESYSSVKAGKQASSQISTLLGEFGTSLLGPFAAITNQIKDFYRHYQNKGLGPVFLMTAAGIITLTLGFGYLLQYSINHWFSELAKALLGFTAANALLAGGFFIRRKRPGMAGFGSSLVGLGLILNYLCTYFIGPYFELIPASLSFILLLLITLSGFALSMQLNTKVVAIVALVGGSLAPIMLLQGSQAPLLYLPYLLLIGICSLIQSRRLKWPVLMEVATLLHIACIEAVTLYLWVPSESLNWQEITALISVNGIFYVYGLTGLLWADIGWNERLSKRILVMPFALMAFILIALSQLTNYNGEIFLVNGLICTLLFNIFRGHKQIRALLLVFSGSFFGFAAFNLISQDYLGHTLLLEGLLLLWLGCKEGFTSVRAEAYLLITIGVTLNIIGIGSALAHTHVTLADFASFGFPLITLLLSTTAVFTCIHLMTQPAVRIPFAARSKEPELNFIELKILVMFKELLSLKYSASLLFISYLVSDDYFFSILPLISVLMLHLAAKDRLRFTEILAWLLLLPLLGQIAFGIIDVGSFSFTKQPIYAQLARVELFLSLLLSYYWYRRYYEGSVIIKVAYWLQIGCYLALPLLFLPKVIRSFEEYLSIALWASCFISLGLAHFVRHRSLIYESQLLTVSAILITAASCLAEIWQGLVALTIGAVFMLFLLKYYRNLSRLWQVQLKLQCYLSLFYFALVIGVIVKTLLNLWPVDFSYSDWSIIAVILCGYFTLLMSRKPVPESLRAGYTVGYALVFACAVSPLLIHMELGLGKDYFSMTADKLLLNLAEAASLIILLKLILANGLAIRVHRKMVPLNVLFWGWHILLSMTYLSWSYQLPTGIAEPLSAILMVIHGCCLMFISLRPAQEQLIKLAAGLFALTCFKVILIDMAAFELIQKIVAFMVIGSILLTVSYFYQKARYRQLAVTS